MARNYVCRKCEHSFQRGELNHCPECGEELRPVRKEKKETQSFQERVEGVGYSATISYNTRAKRWIMEFDAGTVVDAEIYCPNPKCKKMMFRNRTLMGQMDWRCRDQKCKADITLIFK
jgi:DNA-directed RNA polymerase subunit RPC12/RpoP